MALTTVDHKSVNARGGVAASHTAWDGANLGEGLVVDGVALERLMIHRQSFQSAVGCVRIDAQYTRKMLRGDSHTESEPTTANSNGAWQQTAVAYDSEWQGLSGDSDC